MNPIKLIVGLGNPGEEYKFTRHNIGFLIVDYLAEGHKWKKKRLLWEETEIEICGERLTLLKPLTFMNLSGIALKRYLEKSHSIFPEEIIIIHDDLDLPWGKVRLRKNGGSGGHKGVESCITECQTKSFNRIRIGIGRPSGSLVSPSEYVLSEFSIDQKNELSIVMVNIKFIIETVISKGLEKAMQLFNNKDIRQINLKIN